MGHLLEATTLEGRDGAYSATVDPDWCAWSPAGGYLMALALRAAGRTTNFPQPLTMSAHFLSAPKLDRVDVTATVLRRTRVGDSLRVSITQSDKPVLEVLAWCGDTVDGYEHCDAAMPDVPSHADLEERPMPKGPPGFQTIWQNYEHRPCGPLHWEHDDIRAPRQRDWIRLRDFEPGVDPFLDAGRSALILDSFTWPAAAHAHAGDARFVAPTISFSIDFHQSTPNPWLFSDAHCPYAGDGRMAVQNRLWSPDGEPIATASGTLICRPRPKG